MPTLPSCRSGSVCRRGTPRSSRKQLSSVSCRVELDGQGYQRASLPLTSCSHLRGALRCRAAPADNQVESGADAQTDDAQASVPDSEPAANASREDDVLPDNLMDSLYQAAEATTFALNKGIERSTVEILLPEFWDPMSGPVFSQKGDQMRFWRLARCFSENLITMTKATNATISTWEDATFTIRSLNDRAPVSGAEDMVVLAAPDPPGADDCIRINRMVPVGTPLVLFNPRIISGDVGVGLNVRRLRSQFLGQFITTYSIRPIDDIGTIFRKFPELWQVYIQDESMPGRYKKIAELPERPSGDGLDLILDQAMNRGSEDGQEGDEKRDTGIVQQLARTMTSLNRFMKSLQS